MADAGVSEAAKEVSVTRGGARRFGVLIAVLIFIADQVTKSYVLYGLDLEFAGMIPVMPFVDFVLVWNRGISYGLFQQHEDWGRYALVALSLAISAGLAIWLFRLRNSQNGRLLALALGLLIGGALGNVVDRLIYGAVVDFVLLHWGEWRWYVFNVADAAIVAGVALLLYESWLGNGDGAKRAK